MNEIQNDFDETVLYRAIEKEDLDVIKFLLADDRIDINTLNIL